MRRDTNVLVQKLIVTIDAAQRNIRVRVRVLEVLIDAIEKGKVMTTEVTITMDPGNMSETIAQDIKKTPQGLTEKLRWRSR